MTTVDILTRSLDAVEYEELARWFLENRDSQEPISSSDLTHTAYEKYDHTRWIVRCRDAKMATMAKLKWG